MRARAPKIGPPQLRSRALPPRTRKTTTPRTGSTAAPATKVEVHLCIPDDQQQHLPARRRAPALLPRDVPMPRTGEVIYLSSTSAWVVRMVIHEWRNAFELRIEVWLEWVGSARHARAPGFSLTQ